MLVDRYCSICQEEANLHCRMCCKHYCFDHMCHHLQVAHEDNSYTIRLQNERDLDEDKSIQTINSNEHVSFPFGHNSLPASNIQADAKSPSTYTEAELQEQLEYHRSQARRIRNELERRALFASGVVPHDHLGCKTDWDSYSKRKYNNVSTRSNRSRLPKSISSAIQILSNNLRYGAISVEQIKAQIEASRTKS